VARARLVNLGGAVGGGGDLPGKEHASSTLIVSVWIC